MEHEGRKLTLFVLSARRSGGRRHWKHWRRLSALGKQAPVCPSAGPRARARGPETKPPLPISAGRQPLRPLSRPGQKLSAASHCPIGAKQTKPTDEAHKAAASSPFGARFVSCGRPGCGGRLRLNWRRQVDRRQSLRLDGLAAEPAVALPVLKASRAGELVFG